MASTRANLLEQRKCLHKERVQLREIGSVHQHGCRFTVLEHQYGRSDVIVKSHYRKDTLTGTRVNASAIKD